MVETNIDFRSNANEDQNRHMRYHAVSVCCSPQEMVMSTQRVAVEARRARRASAVCAAASLYGA